MSDFRLPEIAQKMWKDPRTLRRWCMAGLIPNAVCTAGGHWRIRGASLDDAVRSVTPPKTARERLRCMDGTVAHGLSKRQWRAGNRAARQDEPLDAVFATIPRWFIEKAGGDTRTVWTSPLFQIARARRITLLAWATVARDCDKPSATRLSKAFGVSRATFYRKWGGVMHHATVVVRSCRDDPTSTAQNHVAPAHATREEVRAWDSAVENRGKNRIVVSEDD